MIAHTTSTGGRPGARRVFISGLFVVLGVLFVAPLDAGEERRVTSSEAVTVSVAGGVYSVTARFRVPEQPRVALAVLTDYERIPTFMPGVSASRVLDRAAGHAVVEQEATSRLMMFSKRVHLVLEIAEEADTLRFKDRCGRSFERYEGTWRLSGQADGTDVVYELIAEPSFDVPEFLLKRLLKRDSGRMIEGLRREIAARSTR